MPRRSSSRSSTIWPGDVAGQVRGSGCRRRRRASLRIGSVSACRVARVRNQHVSYSDAESEVHVAGSLPARGSPAVAHRHLAAPRSELVMSVRITSTWRPSRNARYSAAVKARNAAWCSAAFRARRRGSGERRCGLSAPLASIARGIARRRRRNAHADEHTIAKSPASPVPAAHRCGYLRHRSGGRGSPPAENSGSFCPRTRLFIRSIAVTPVSMKSRGSSRQAGLIAAPRCACVPPPSAGRRQPAEGCRRRAERHVRARRRTAAARACSAAAPDIASPARPVRAPRSTIDDSSSAATPRRGRPVVAHHLDRGVRSHAPRAA